MLTFPRSLPLELRVDDQNIHREVFSEFSEVTAKTREIVGYVYQVRNEPDEEKRKVLYDKIMSNLPLQEYSDFDRIIIREYFKETIKLLADRQRDSGFPYVTHGFDVLYLLLKQNVPLHTALAGIGHDNIEELTGDILKFSLEKKTKKSINSFFKHDNYKALDDEAKSQLKMFLADYKRMDPKQVNIILLEAEYRRLDKVFDSGIKKFLDTVTNLDGKAKESIYSSTKSNIERLLIYTIVSHYKLTRFESIEDYYKYTDRMTAEELNSDPNLNWLRKAYLKKTGKELVFTKQDIDEINKSTIKGKCADRTANTIDIYQPPDFMGRMKMPFKNIKVLDTIARYKHKQKAETLEEIAASRKMLKRANDLRMEYENRILEKSMQNPFSQMIYAIFKRFYDWQEKIYSQSKGYESVDYGFDWNISSGTIRLTFDKMIKEKGRYNLGIFFMNHSNIGKYNIIRGIRHINSLYENENFYMQGLENLGQDEKLGFFDRAGTKYMPLWIAKWGVRKAFGVASEESFKKKIIDPMKNKMRDYFRN